MFVSDKLITQVSELDEMLLLDRVNYYIEFCTWGICHIVVQNFNEMLNPQTRFGFAQDIFFMILTLTYRKGVQLWVHVVILPRP